MGDQEGTGVQKVVLQQARQHYYLKTALALRFHILVVLSDLLMRLSYIIATVSAPLSLSSTQKWWQAQAAASTPRPETM